MTFDAMEFLTGLYIGPPVATVAKPTDVVVDADPLANLTPTLNRPMPCPDCCCPTFWESATGRVSCERCDPRPVMGWYRVLNFAETADGDVWEVVSVSPEAHEVIEPCITCPTCGGIDAWWTVEGQRRCRECEPPYGDSRELRRRALAHRTS